MNNQAKVAHGVQPGIGTQVVWEGEQVEHPYNATQTPIIASAAYGYQDIDAWYDIALGKQPGFIYSRMSNPTVAALEATLANGHEEFDVHAAAPAALAQPHRFAVEQLE